MKNKHGMQEKKDQVTINTEAKETIKDLFPKIPDNDLYQIIKTAFQLGDRKVGTAEEIPLIRRAQLSVVAHIRHCYTKYDKLLRQVSYNDARHMVESETLKRLVEWRGDDEKPDDASKIQDVYKEAVVISSDEDTDDEIEEGQIVPGGERRARPMPEGRAVGYTTTARPLSPIHLETDDDAAAYHIVPQVVRRREPQDEIVIAARREQNRFAAWERARQQYRREIIYRQAEPVVERIYRDEIGREMRFEALPQSYSTVERAPPSGQSIVRSVQPVDNQVRPSIH